MFLVILSPFKGRKIGQKMQILDLYLKRQVAKDDNLFIFMG